MMKRVMLSTAALSLAVGVAAFGTPQQEETEGAQFGTEEDVAFAAELWDAMEGYEDWKLRSDVYPGTSPHGKFLRLFANWVHVGDRSYPIIVKDNYGGEDVTKEKVEESPSQHLGAVTIMLKREDGYAPEGGDWYWVKYEPDGSVEKGGDRDLAGRVTGCIRCHESAEGGDFLFSNDEG